MGVANQRLRLAREKEIGPGACVVPSPFARLLLSAHAPWLVRGVKMAAVAGARALSLAALRGGGGAAAAVANCCCRRWRRRLLSTGTPPQAVGAGLTEAVLRDAVKQKQVTRGRGSLSVGAAGCHSRPRPAFPSVGAEGGGAGLGSSQQPCEAGQAQKAALVAQGGLGLRPAGPFVGQGGTANHALVLPVL